MDYRAYFGMNQQGKVVEMEFPAETEMEARRVADAVSALSLSMEKAGVIDHDYTCFIRVLRKSTEKEIEDGVAEDGWTDITSDEYGKRLHSDRVSDYATELQKRYD